MNYIATDILVHAFLFTCVHIFLEGYIPRSEISKYGVYLSLALVDTHQTIFTNGCMNLYTHQQFMRIQFFYILTNTCCFLYHFSHSGTCVREIHCGFKLYCLDAYLRWALFHIINNHLYNFVLVRCSFFYWSCLSLFLMICNNSSYILHMSPLLDIAIEFISFHSDCLLILFMVFLKEQKALIFM